MAVRKEPSGHRSVQVDTVVKGTPEQVWDAIATGPGISAWFVPTQMEGRVGGALSLDFGGGMVSSAKIVAWNPPRSFTAEDESWLPGGPKVATEWSVKPEGAGTCRVSVVHRMHASSDEWDAHLEGTETGWPGYFRVLGEYLEHYAGAASASFVLMAPSGDDGEALWTKFSGALGIPSPRVGTKVQVKSGTGAVIIGTVKAVDDLPQGKGVMIALTEPAPGLVLASAMECMGMRMATLQGFFYGPRAAEAAAQKPAWEAWLHTFCPPSSEAVPPAS